MRICKADGCVKPTRFKTGKEQYCPMHKERLKRNGTLNRKTGSHGLEKLPHDLIDNLIRENIDKKDSEITKIIHEFGFNDATEWNIKYRRLRLGIKKYDGSSAKKFVRIKAMNKYGTKCELCGYHHLVDVHHIIEKKNGGSNDIENLLVLCPNCHALITRKIIDIKSREEISDVSKKIKTL